MQGQMGMPGLLGGKGFGNRGRRLDIKWDIRNQVSRMRL